MKKRMILIFVTIIVIIGIIAIGIYLKPEKEDKITPIITESTELKVEYEEATSLETYTSEITLQDDTVNVSGDGVTVTGSTITIKSAGTYLITGTLTNGNIIIDANGSLYINGGNIVVAGSTSSGNGSFDYDSEFIVSGGTVIAYGAKGMWQTPSTSSTQYGIAFDETGSQGDNITISDDSGNEIANFTTDNSYGVIFISSSEIKNGETYNLYVNGNSQKSVTVTSIISGGVTSNGMNMQGGGKKPNDETGMPSQGGGKNR